MKTTKKKNIQRSPQKMINLFQPCLGKEELAALKNVFSSNWIGKGQHVLDFERQFAESLGVEAKHFTSTNSCTEGIFLAGDLFKFGSKDEIIVPSISFIAVGNSVVSRGARLVFCDVDSRTLNTTAEFIEKKITPRTKAIFLNHYGGVSCDMDPILALCKAKNIIVIEDAACAIHSFYHGRAVGTIGDMGLWSFDAMKIVCTGDGGMIYLRDLNWVVEAKEHLYMGLPNRQTSGMDSSKSGTSSWWEFDINCPGRRAIMNNIAGAIGLVQMKKLPAFLKRRKQIHDFYSKELSSLSWLLLPPPLPKDITSSYYFYWIQSDYRDELANFLKDKGIYTSYRYWPLHRIKFFSPWATKLPNANMACEKTLNLPIHQALSDDDINRIVQQIKAFSRSRGL